MKKFLTYTIFAIITILIMLPLYQHGFVFLLDMVFAPQINLADYLQHGLQPSFPMILIIKVLSYILHPSVIQKIILSLLLFLPGVFMYQLVQKLEIGNRKQEIENKGSVSYFLFSISFISGLFYMLNPWVFERFLAGHWLVLLGYAFFPLLIKLFLQLLKNPNKSGCIKFTILFSLFPIINLHWFYISTLFLIILFIVHLVVQYRNKKLEIGNKKQEIGNKKLIFISYFVFPISCFLIINSFWLFSFFQPQQTFDQITLNDFQAYQTTPDPVWGHYFNTLSLYGFWNPDYILPKDQMPFWWTLAFIILILFIIGLYQVFKKKNILGITLGILFIPTLLVSVGYAHWLTRPIIEFLYYILPGFKGLRETGKLIGLLAFSYALIVPVGAQVLARLFARDNNCRDEVIFEGDPDGHRGRLQHWIIYSCLLVICLLSVHNMFFAFSHQLKACDYPVSWYQVNQILTPHDKVLFLPWHGYPRLSFAGFKRVTNPAPRFFRAEVVTAKTIENIYLPETKADIWDEKVFRLLHGFETVDENIEFFKSQNITHIILAKEADYNRYGFLGESEQLKKILDTDDLTLYKID